MYKIAHKTRTLKLKVRGKMTFGEVQKLVKSNKNILDWDVE